MRLDLLVIPRASRTSIGPIRDGRLIVRVTAPPVDDAANEAVVAALCEALKVPKRSLRIVAGQSSRRKTVEYREALTPAFRARLQALSERD